MGAVQNNNKMIISFQNATPAPLVGVVHLDSQIWNTKKDFLQGKSYQIYAPSGKGKSTFAHIIYGLRDDFDGDILIDNQNTKQISHENWASIRQTKMSIIFQDLRLFADLTARENIEVKTVLLQQNNSSTDTQGNIKEDIKENINQMADKLGISHIMDKKANILSYGERQRVAILRALIQPFEVLLADEPFSHLDENNIKIASQMLIERCKQQNATLLMTSLGYDYGISFDEKVLLG